jgi:hypothetical protein
MDGISLHLLSRLDAIRETQLAHGQILTRLAERPASTPPATWRASWMPIAAGAGQWAAALLALAYLAQGGDAGRALELLHKLF